VRQAGKTSGGPPAATWAWSAVIVAASITGGLLAAAVGRASWVTALGVSAVIGVAVALLAVPLGWATQVPSSLPPGREHRAGGWEGASGAVGSPPGQVHHRRDPPGRAPEPENSAGPDGVVRVLPLAAETPAGAEWWQKTGTPAARHKGTERETAAPLSSYLDSAVVVQCPRCGSFLADVRQGPAEWSFGCQECGNKWAWHPRTPWPSVAVRPRLRGENSPPPGRHGGRP
jgi:hypothetical protein